MEFNAYFASLSDGAARWTLLSLMMLIPLPSRAGPKDRYSARQDGLMVTVTKVENLKTVPRHFGTPLKAISGYHFVVVSLQVRNVGRGAQCAYFAPVVLRASFGIETHRMTIMGGDPEINQLLPGEKTEGSYTFEVKDGVTPFELILSPEGGKRGCGSRGLFSDGLSLGTLKLHIPPADSPASIPGKEQ